MPRRLRFAPPGYWLHLTQRQPSWCQALAGEEQSLNREGQAWARRAQLVPGISRGGAKPQSERASRGNAAATAVRTATKLSHRVTERYGAGY